MKRVLTSIWFLALFVAIPIIIFLPPIFNKYNIELLEKKRKINLSNNIYFKDLNNDGEIERIETYQSHSNLLSFQCFDHSNRLIDQYNFPHLYSEHLIALHFFDVDRDGLLEVYGYTFLNDSVFLSWVEPLDSVPEFKSTFVATINTEKRKKLDARIRQLSCFDFDGDSDLEIAFSLEVGYNWFPRKIFTFHPESDSLHSSLNFGSHFSNLVPFDYRGDGERELLCVSSSAGNIPPGFNIDYKDDRPRLFVFNNNLEIIWDPIEFPLGLGARVYPFFTDEKKGELIVLYHNFSSNNTATFMVKTSLDGSGASSDTLFFPAVFKKTVWVKKENNNEIIIYGRQGLIYKVSNELQITDSINLNFAAEHDLVASLDVNDNGNPEYFILNENEKQLEVYFDNFQQIILLDFDEVLAIPYVIDSPKKNQFLVFGNRFYYVYQTSRNPFFHIKYPFFMLIYLAVVGFIWVLQTARMKQLQEKLELQNQVRDLQLRTLKNQLDPHFIFNTFNTIASVVKQGRNEEVYDVIVQFSKMVRANLDNSSEIFTTLRKELDFVKDYLLIQKFRFKNKFEYKIIAEKNVNEKIRIPKLLIQIHVENALKHGIRPAINSGLINVHVNQDRSNLIIEIKDNGIGRKKSKILKTGGTGIGLKTIRQIIDLNNQKWKNKISQEIIDLEDENGNAAGTKVLITIQNV